MFFILGGNLGAFTSHCPSKDPTSEEDEVQIVSVSMVKSSTSQLTNGENRDHAEGNARGEESTCRNCDKQMKVESQTRKVLAKVVSSGNRK
jgi:hypothetical protein